MTSSIARRLVGGALAAFLTVLASIAFAGPASAHSSLVLSDPARGASVSAGPQRVTLTFNEALQDSYDTLTVVGPDQNFWQQGDAQVVGQRISIALRPLGPAGEYRINYRVTSADGHPVSGQVPFTLTTAGTGTPGPSADDSDSSDGSGIPVWVYAVVVVVVVGVAGVFVVRRRART
ncbi:copper resistance CopC family protein [Williamsia sp. MIQD14]|uniref:copper resistance CopC family protein n=1 Tax=Williamsia sp. MIQD14 TaxID=3425703 RepID=UPI003DA15657